MGKSVGLKQIHTVGNDGNAVPWVSSAVLWVFNYSTVFIVDRSPALIR